MKLLLSILCACVLIGGCTPVKINAPTAQRQIQSLLDDMMIAANAHDTDRYMAPFAHTSSLVFAFNGMVIHGWDELQAQQLKWWKNGKSDAVYTQNGKIEFMTLGPDLAVTTESLASRRTGPDGKLLTGSFVVTYIWQKQADGWRAVYAHESWVR